MRYTGVTARGIIAPIFKKGDNLIEGVCGSVLRAASAENFKIEKGDVIGITESIVARSEGNYASCAQIAEDLKAKFGGGKLGIVFPILSRNRFSILLKAIAMSCEKLYVQLSYPGDEVGNELLSIDALDDKKVNPYSQSFTEAQFRELFGYNTVHRFTGIDYIDFYKSFGSNIEVVFSNDPAYILNYAENVLCCDIHTRERTKRIIKAAGGRAVYNLSDILCESVSGSGYNTKYGLLGSNMATEDSVKLFPERGGDTVKGIKDYMKEKTGQDVEVLIYGDGCFKDPVGGIWEFADPVVSPAFTEGLAGTPSEIKMKYFADNEFAGLKGDELSEAMRQRIREKEGNLVGEITAQGTTPRRYTDLIGSLCDLVSGSGDRGTPIIYIKGYFTNYATE